MLPVPSTDNALPLGVILSSKGKRYQSLLVGWSFCIRWVDVLKIVCKEPLDFARCSRDYRLTVTVTQRSARRLPILALFQFCVDNFGLHIFIISRIFSVLLATSDVFLFKNLQLSSGPHPSYFRDRLKMRFIAFWSAYVINFRWLMSATYLADLRRTWILLHNI